MHMFVGKIVYGFFVNDIYENFRDLNKCKRRSLV